MFRYVAFALGLGVTYLLLTSAKKTKFERNGKGVARYLMGLGYSKAIASGISGNIYVESKYNPLAVGDNGQSFGLAQWHKSRWDALKKWSRERGRDIRAFETQLDFIDWELKNTEKRANQKLQTTTTPRESALVFARYYERPAFISEERMTKAEEIYKKL